MPYERSQALENRLRDLLVLLRESRSTAPKLASELDVSQPTIARCIAALRKRGYTIRAVKDREGWSYRLSSEGLTSTYSKDLP